MFILSFSLCSFPLHVDMLCRSTGSTDAPGGMPRGSPTAAGGGSPRRGQAVSPSPSPRGKPKAKTGAGRRAPHRVSAGAERRDGALYWVQVSTDTLEVLDAAFEMEKAHEKMGPVELGWKLGKRFGPKQLAGARPELDRLFGSPTVRRATAPQVTEHLQRQMAALMSAALLTRQAELVRAQLGDLEAEHAVAAADAARAKAEVRAQRGSAESKDAARRAAQQKLAAGSALAAARQEHTSVLAQIESHLSSCGWRSAADELIEASTTIRRLEMENRRLTTGLSQADAASGGATSLLGGMREKQQQLEEEVLSLKLMNFIYLNDEFCAKIDEFCTKHDDFKGARPEASAALHAAGDQG